MSETYLIVTDTIKFNEHVTVKIDNWVGSVHNYYLNKLFDTYLTYYYYYICYSPCLEEMCLYLHKTNTSSTVKSSLGDFQCPLVYMK